MIRSSRALVGLVIALGVGLLAAVLAIWTLGDQVGTNQDLIRQQRAALHGLAAQNAENTQALSEQQRLAQALARQVRQLGGTPLTQAPSPAASARATSSTAAVPSVPPQPSSPRPSATPRPTPRPTPSHRPTPTPSPSPTCTVKLGPVCL